MVNLYPLSTLVSLKFVSLGFQLLKLPAMYKLSVVGVLAGIPVT